MNGRTDEYRGYGFVIGLVTGTCVGAGLAMWLVPRSASELRQRLADSAQRLRNGVTEQYQQATTRVGETVDDLTRKGRDARDGVADAVVRGAHEVERFATSVKSGA